MLYYNCKIFIFFIVVFIGIALPLLLAEIAKMCSGWLLLPNNNRIKNEQASKLFLWGIHIFLLVAVVIGCFLWMPSVFDIPEYLGGTGKTIDAKVVKMVDGNNRDDGYLHMLSVKVQDNKNENNIVIRDSYFVHIEQGDNVKINYLPYCKRGTLIEKNGKSVYHKRIVYRWPLIIIMLEAHIYIIVRMLEILREKHVINGQFKLHLHKKKCTRYLYILEMITSWLTIILIGVMFGTTNFALNILWIVLIIIWFILFFVFKIEDFYLLKVDKKYLSFCDRKYRYQNEIKNLTEKDVRSFIEKNPVK